MKVLALTAVNLNAKYLNCVPLFIQYWLSLKPTNSSVTFEPKVLIIADELPLDLRPYEQWCQLFPFDTKVSSTFASQVVRIFQPSMELADYVITTDIDMLPLTDRMFQVAIDFLGKGSEFVICRDVLPEGQYPICYNVASPKTWQEVNGVRSQNEIRSRMSELFLKLDEETNYRGQHGGAGWFLDQEELFSMVNKFEAGGGSVTKLRDYQTKHRRLDRYFMPFPINWFFLPAVSLGFFTDYHVHHPVLRHKRYINTVLAQKSKKRFH